MRRLALAAALLLLALPAHAVDTKLCDDDGVTETPAFASRPGGGATCLEIDPGNGGPKVEFQYEEFHKTQPCGDGGGTVGNKRTLSGGPKTQIYYDTTIDNYLSPACRNKDVMFWGGGGSSIGGYDSEWIYFKNSHIINGWKCAGGNWTGTGSAVGLSCSGPKSRAHSDGIQLRGQPVAHGWFVFQDSDLVNGYNLQFLGQVDASDGKLGSQLWQGVHIGRQQAIGKATTWIDDCLARSATPDDKICRIGNFSVGNGPPLVVAIDVWGSTAMRFSGKGGKPGLIVIVNTGCSKTGCGQGAVGYTHGWPWPLNAKSAGPGTCDGTTNHGQISASPPTYCFPNIESMMAGATAAGLDLDPHTPGAQNAPPFIRLSCAGWATPPAACAPATQRKVSSGRTSKSPRVAGKPRS